MGVYVVERDFGEPVPESALSATLERLGPCLDQYGLRWLQSYVSEDKTRMTCVFEAPDAESVRAANRSAEAHFDRVWRAEVIGPESSQP